MPWCTACNSETWWLSRARPAGRVVVCGHASSSLDVLRPLAENGLLDPWDSVLAVSQWAGRGQLRRVWESPAGNVYAALVLPAPPKEYDSLVAVVLGYCITAFFRLKGLNSFMKWPNDILVNNAKTGGVLVEERKGVLMAGIGLNVCSAPPPGLLRQEAAVAAASLREAGHVATPLGLWCDLVDFVKISYETALTQGAPHATARLAEQFLCWVGQEVTVREGDSPGWNARILGLAPDGALRVKPAGAAGERLLTSGSIWRAP